MRDFTLFALSWTISLLAATAVHADLVVRVNSPKVTGSKAVVKLEMKNTFDVPVQSARATVFLVDDKDRVVGHSATKWVVGGAKGEHVLAAGHEASYNFVISAIPSGTTTNLSANVSFNRVVLANGKVADLAKQVVVSKAQK